jgi:hypothetical protein
MGGDEQFESLEHLINTSKPIKIGLLKNISKFNRLASVRFERLFLLNRPRNLARPLAFIK